MGRQISAPGIDAVSWPVVPFRNADFADLIERLGDLYELDGAVVYRVVAYRKAAARMRMTAESVERLSIEGRLTELPDIGDTIAAKVTEYRTTGTDELAVEVAKHLSDRSAVLMANHGLFTVGRDPQHAMHVAALVERTAQIIWGAKQIGEVIPIPDEVNKTFAGYYRYGRTGKF